MISGVCAGIAEYFGLDPTLVRFIAVLLLVVGNVATVVAYLVMAFVVPETLEGAGPSVAAVVPPRQKEGGIVSEEHPIEQETGPGDVPEPGDETPVPPPPTHATPPPPPPPPADVPITPQVPLTPAGPDWPDPPKPGPAGVTVGVALILLGIAIMAGRYVGGFSIWTMWPLIIVIVGVIQLFTPGKEGWGLLRVAEALSTIAFGLVLFGCFTGIIGWVVWWHFISLWPLLLVALGLGIIGKSAGAAWVRALGTLVVIGTLAIATWGTWTGRSFGVWSTAGSGDDFSYTERVGSVERATLKLDAGAGDIEIAEGRALVTATGRTAFGSPDFAVQRKGTEADVTLGMRDGHGAAVWPGGPTGRLGLELADDVVWDADLDMGLSALRADLTDVPIEKLALSTGMSDSELVLGDVPDGVEEATVQVDGGFARIDIRVPSDAEVRVVSDSALLATNLDPSLRSAGDGEWETSGFEAARARGQGVWVISVDAGFGTLDIDFR